MRLAPVVPKYCGATSRDKVELEYVSNSVLKVIEAPFALPVTKMLWFLVHDVFPKMAHLDLWSKTIITRLLSTLYVSNPPYEGV